MSAEDFMNMTTEEKLAYLESQQTATVEPKLCNAFSEGCDSCQ